MARSLFDARPYQGEAIAWIERHPRCCLFLEMGLGKTVSTLTALQHLLDRCEAERCLIVAPRKVADSTWQAEAVKWRHLSLRVATVSGTAPQRLRALREEADVYVIGRDSLPWLVTLKEPAGDFDMLVLDELTSFKNHSSKRTRAALQLSKKARRVVGLTGTPTPQGLADLWAQMLVVDLGARLGTSVTRWREQYFNVWRRDNVILKLTPKPGAEEKVRALVSDICLTMLAAEHNPLPPLETVDVEVPLTAGHRAAYSQFERDRVAELEGEEVTAASAAVLLGKLAQHAGGAVYDDGGVPHPTGGEKMEALMRILDGATSPVLVFYQYKHEAARILAAIQGKGRKYESAADLVAWNAGEVPVLLCHPASTAYGLNLQYGGHTMVWYSLGWNLEQYGQAVARLHRQGQRHAVTCYRLLCPGTVDDQLRAALGRKATGQRAMMTALSAIVKRYV